MDHDGTPVANRDSALVALVRDDTPAAGRDGTSAATSATTVSTTPPRRNQSVVIIQTGDVQAYSDLFEQTAPANMEHAGRHGYTYWRFDGVIRGMRPWHASFNRIYLFEMARQAKQYDWIFFLDNDALVVDHTKPLDEFMNATCMLVAARGISDEASAFWEINAGVMMLNLRHKANSCDLITGLGPPKCLAPLSALFLYLSTCDVAVTTNLAQNLFDGLRDRALIMHTTRAQPPNIFYLALHSKGDARDVHRHVLGATLSRQRHVLDESWSRQTSLEESLHQGFGHFLMEPPCWIAAF